MHQILCQLANQPLSVFAVDNSRTMARCIYIDVPLDCEGRLS